jgi:uncharacterized repeat protein (TIGR01451 family)
MLLPKKRTGIEANRRSRPHLPIPSTTVWLRLVMMLTVVVSGFVFMTGGSRGAAATGTISGNVFQDFNANGVRDTSAQIPNSGGGNIGVAVDSGIQGVTVTAYSPTGAAAGSAVTDASGNYSINTAGSTGPYRVEFTTLPAGYYDGPFGANSKTTVQIVAEGGATGVDVGLVFPGDFSQNNPTVVTQRYVGGASAGDNRATIISFPYTAGSNSTDPNTPTSQFDLPAPTTVATANQVGATWGVVWSRNESRLYASSFMKRYAGLGPSGTGAIYRIDPATQTVTTYADLNAIFGAGTAGVSTHNHADPHDGGNTTWNAIGKVGLGGMAISDSGDKLYVINLANRTLYELPIGVAPSAANIRTTAVPLNPPGCANSADVRPFAAQFYRGTLYVGMTCTGESTTAGGTVDGNTSQLRAYVYQVNPTTLAFGGSPVLDVPLNYPRACADSKQLGPGSCFSANWRPWSPIYRNAAELPPSQFLKRALFPQPWLTAIDFDKGNLVFSLRDRLGDQSGIASQDNPARSDLYYGVAVGDILRACGNPTSGWTLESNGRCAGAGGGPQNNGEGPGNAEFYYQDDSPIYNSETVNGGQLQVPGFPDVLAGLIHPIPYVPNSNDDTFFDNGVRWFLNGSGAFSKNYRAVNDDVPAAQFFGKANGLGDFVALTAPPASEIGNYVWNDLNKNGIQDPNEPAIPGVTVKLFQGVTELASVVTNAQGHYYFNSTNVTGGIQPSVGYEIRIAAADPVLVGKNPTLANVGSDLHDSDGVVSGGNIVAAASVPLLGANDHTFDFGFSDTPIIRETDLEIRKRASPTCVEPGSRITFTVTVTNLGPLAATGVVVTDDLPFGLVLESVTPSQGSCNNQDPMTCNLGNLAVGAQATITIVESVPNNPSATTFTNRASVTANEPDSNPNNNTAQATSCLLVPGDPNQIIGPGDPWPTGTINDQKAGSVLFYNFYTSSPSTPNIQNTRVTMTNTNAGQFVFVHLFFVDGATCSISDRFVCLTANQTLSFLTSDLDPGTTGYLVGVAVDDILGCPISFNYLIGDAYIKTSSGFEANLAAEAIGRIEGETSGATCNDASFVADLIFNGAPGNYERVPRVLAASNVMDYPSGNRQLLIVNRFGGNFLSTGYTIPGLFGQVFNNQEVSASFTVQPTGCQLVRVMSNSFPQLAPPFSTHITAGNTGWMKFFSPEDVGLMGAIINFNENVPTSPGAFNQGRNLHKLTFATSETIRIPIFPPI